ncbi:MAG: hypothetical protein ACRC6M_08810 [Microcystaceae cyanobacterium]
MLRSLEVLLSTGDLFLLRIEKGDRPFKQRIISYCKFFVDYVIMQWEKYYRTVTQNNLSTNYLQIGSF